MTKQEMIKKIEEIMKQVYTIDLKGRKYIKLQYTFNGIFVTMNKGSYIGDSDLKRLGEATIEKIYNLLMRQI